MAETSPAAAPAPSELRQSLEAKDAVFTKLLSLIPAKYYIVDTPEEVSPQSMLKINPQLADGLCFDVG